MNYYIIATTVVLALYLPSTSRAFLATKGRQPPPLSKTCIFQQQFYDADGNPVQFYDANGNPIYPAQQYDQEQYNQQQQEQQQYYDQQRQQGVDNTEQPTLLITDNIQEEMARATSGVDVPLDYLALARERAARRVESSNSNSSDEEWFEMAEAKKREFTNPDIDWENFDPADTELDEANAAAKAAGASGVGGVELEELEGGVMMTEGGLVVDNPEGDQLMF